MLGLYAIAVAVIVAWPTPVDQNSRGLLMRALGWVHRHGVPTWFDYDFVEFFANIAMFIPLGLLLGIVLGPRWWWLAIVFCAGLSISIELYQYLLLPHRFATVRDVVANSTGGLLGAVVSRGVMTRLKRQSRSVIPPYRPTEATSPVDIRI